jgi:hypothetical protein
MTRRETIRRRDQLAARLAPPADVLRGSLLERTVHHTSGCPKCARGEGHPLWVLNVNYPGAKTRQLSLRPERCTTSEDSSPDGNPTLKTSSESYTSHAFT